MISFVTGFGPEIPRDAFETVERVEREICDHDRGLSKRKGRFSVIVVNVVAVDPARGVIPNSVSLKRFSGELWSTWNVAFSEFLAADDEERGKILRGAACSAIEALEGKYLESHDVQMVVGRIGGASAL